MPERGTQVQMPRAAQMVLRGLEYFTWPLRLDDYLELITPFGRRTSCADASSAYAAKPTTP